MKKGDNLGFLHKNNKHPVLKQKLSLGQRASDLVTLFVGSWTFIILVFIVLAIWMFLNSLMLIYQWDPYPFILLNFVLSCLAAVQAPIILMSQNRQADRDRIAAKYDYQVNRKAEREISKMQKDLDSIKVLVKKAMKKK
ncbi:DUF1003 domain-containing protein [Candidatus Woesearchaeota archaeon]|nr:DUF1003 domain-containing protein [Candidatus Woesearchaeota archaeon]